MSVWELCQRTMSCNISRFSTISVPLKCYRRSLPPPIGWLLSSLGRLSRFSGNRFRTVFSIQSLFGTPRTCVIGWNKYDNERATLHESVTSSLLGRLQRFMQELWIFENWRGYSPDDDWEYDEGGLGHWQWNSENEVMDYSALGNSVGLSFLLSFLFLFVLITMGFYHIGSVIWFW